MTKRREDKILFDKKLGQKHLITKHSASKFGKRESKVRNLITLKIAKTIRTFFFSSRKTIYLDFVGHSKTFRL